MKRSFAGMEYIPLIAGDADRIGRAAPFDRRMRPIYIGVGIAWLLLAIALPMVRVQLDIAELAVVLTGCALLLWFAVCLRMRGQLGWAAGIEAWTLLNVVCFTSLVMASVVGRGAAPLADPLMDAADRAIASGLDWRSTITAITRHSLAMGIANWAYTAIQWQGTLLVVLCCSTGRAERCSAFLLRWMIALAIVCATFAFLPCLGAYAFYGIAHSAVPDVHSNVGWHQPALLTLLRSAAPIHLHMSMLDGIIEFPSFHTAAAILFTWGFWAIRPLRWAMLALNVMMVLAAVPIGGHYYVDLLAGALVAWVSIMVPDWWAGLRRHGADVGLAPATV